MKWRSLICSKYPHFNLTLSPPSLPSHPPSLPSPSLPSFPSPPIPPPLLSCLPLPSPPSPPLPSLPLPSLPQLAPITALPPPGHCLPPFRSSAVDSPPRPYHLLAPLFLLYPFLMVSPPPPLLFPPCPFSSLPFPLPPPCGSGSIILTRHSPSCISPRFVHPADGQIGDSSTS